MGNIRSLFGYATVHGRITTLINSFDRIRVIFKVIFRYYAVSHTVIPPPLPHNVPILFSTAVSCLDRLLLSGSINFSVLADDDFIISDSINRRATNYFPSRINFN